MGQLSPVLAAVKGKRWLVSQEVAPVPVRPSRKAGRTAVDLTASGAELAQTRRSPALHLRLPTCNAKLLPALTSEGERIQFLHAGPQKEQCLTHDKQPGSVRYFRVLVT